MGVARNRTGVPARRRLPVLLVLIDSQRQSLSRGELPVCCGMKAAVLSTLT